MDLLKNCGWALVLLLWMAGTVSAQSPEVLWWELEHPERYVNGYNDPDRDIWELRNEAELLHQRLGQPKRLLLHQGPFPGKDDQGRQDAVPLRQVRAWLTGPNGERQDVSLQESGGDIEVEVPGVDAASGIYLLGCHFTVGRQDIDGDGVKEQVHYYGKFLLRHDNGNSINGGEREVFFGGDAMPLEIGPVQASRYSGIIQIAHRPHIMVVYYRGEPLADAEVTVLTERGWQTRATTGNGGRFEIVPVASRGADRNCELYLYIVRHHDRQRGEYHIATIPMIVDPPWPEWSHYTTTFITWGLAGALFAALLAFGLIQRRRRRNLARLARFKEASCV
jgi:hypothetical protein